jgi:arylsulfatase A-like enzyme
MKRQARNIILVFADELRADMLGCFGNDICRTPSLDRLAEEGTVLTQCMVTQPTCTPSRASILSGCFPSALRCRMVGCVTPDDPRLLPRVLSESGYHTASIGKVHLVPQGNEPDVIEGARRKDGTLNYYGFQRVDLVNGHGMRCFGPDYSGWLQQRCPEAQKRIGSAQPVSPGVNHGKIKTETYALPPEAHSGEYIVERTAAYLREAVGGEEPFFLHVSFNDPHHPFTVPEPYASMYEPEEMPPPLPPVSKEGNATSLQLRTLRGGRTEFSDGCYADHVIGTPPVDYTRCSPRDWQGTEAIYYGMTSLLDDQVGRIMETLEETGLAEETIVVFVSDHGEYLGDHGFCGKGFHYDSVIRTPVIVRGPGIKSGQRLRGVASTVDLAPTLLDLVGIEEPEGMQGVSMCEAFVGSGQLPRDAVLTENDDDFVPMRVRTLTTRTWKITMYAGRREGELYNREEDPDELHNRWDDPDCAEVKAKMLAALADHVVCAVDGSNGRVQSPSKPVAKFLPRGAGESQ